ncbi:L-lactate permease [Amycolatopsis acidiphila]|uniref:L-lactate permease n=1 Tax=Amycolatopsis acidiphila TaxID=715473 RepID=A0A558ALG3_9PSEU|nr:L-lactate permease [Amycolatopsis acidiphila]TVT25102.1 L-lactate permease [Amycolatopsis acidiphila]UIJ57385.1 L-lactate permease [Amycolatopsis acidiphila]GHG84502.1 L-lactate permease [Amycolatopsis acidiphila]
MHHQLITPVGRSLAWSALTASLPLVLLLVLLGVVRMRAHWAALISVLAALAVAVLVYRLPPVTALSTTVEGAAAGLFPIVWIVLNAVWVNRLVQVSGYLDRVRETFLVLSDDVRVQALVVAFCFGSLLEAMAGFGAPIAVVAALLLAMGYSPVRAATVALFADAAGTAFGSVGNPILTLSKTTGLAAEPLGDMVGRQSAMVAFFVPFVLLLVLGGWRCLRELWPLALALAAGFSVGQFVVSNYVAFQLADLGGAVLAALAGVAVLRLRRTRPVAAEAPGAARSPTAMRSRPLTLWPTVRAFVPYAVLTALLALVSIDGPVSRAVGGLSVSFVWPGTKVVRPNGSPVSLRTFTIDFVSATGTVLLVTGLIAMLVLRIRWRTGLREYKASAVQIRFAAATVMCVLAFAYLLNYSGQAATIGAFFAGAGSAFVLLSPVLGWLGVAATGSDTSANALFGAVQVASAQHIGVSAYLLAGANSAAGSLGKLISPQNLAMAAAAVGLSGHEGVLFRRTFWWSLLYLALFIVIIYLMAKGPLSGIVI